MVDISKSLVDIYIVNLYVRVGRWGSVTTGFQDPKSRCRTVDQFPNVDRVLLGNGTGTGGMRAFSLLSLSALLSSLGDSLARMD